MASTTTKGLLALPHEMLMRIKAHIHSLEAHVNFSLTCNAIRNLYDESFWKFACMSAGWTMLEVSKKPEQTAAGEQDKGNPMDKWAALCRIVVKDAPKFAAYEEGVQGWTTVDGELPAFAGFCSFVGSAKAWVLQPSMRLREPTMRMSQQSRLVKK